MGMLSAGNRMSVPMKFLSLTLIVLLLLLLCRQIMKLLMRSRWRHQIFSVDVIDVFIILIGLCCIGIFFIEDTYISSLIHHLYEAEPNEYVSFYTACEFHLVFSYMTAALLCISTIRLWKLLSFAKNIQLFEITLIIARGCIIATLLAFLLTAASFSSFSYILLHTKSVHFSEAYKSFHYLLLTALGFASESNHELFEQAHFIIGPIFYLAYTISVTLILLNLFITVLMVYYDKVQKIQISMSRRFKFGAYMKSKFQSCFKRKKNPQSLRLRGGGDTLTPQSKVLAHGVGIKVVPKPNEMLNINEVLIPKSKIYSMKVAMHEAVQSIPQTDSANNEKSKRIKLITAAVLNIHKTEVPEDLQSKDVSFFYSGIAKSKLEVIPLKKFLDMKSIIENMFNSEQSYKKGRDATINDINVGKRDSDINIVSNQGITEERNLLNFNQIEKEFDEILSFIDTVTHVEEDEEEGKQRIDSSAKQSLDGKVYPIIDKAFDVDINKNKNKKSLDPDVTEISYDDKRKYGRGEDSSDHNITKSHFLGSKSKNLTDTRTDDIISDENKKLLISNKIEPAFESIPPSEYPKVNEKKRRKGEKRKQTISENVLGRVCCLDCSNEKKRRMANFQKAQPRISEGYNKKSTKDFLNYTDNITKQKYGYKDYIKQTEKYGGSQSDKTKERVDYCGLSIPLSSGFRSKIVSDTVRHTARNQQNRKHINRYQGNMGIDAKLSNYKKNIKPTQINTCLTNNQRKDRVKLPNLDKAVNYDCKPPCSEPYQNSSSNFQLGHTVRHTMCEKLKLSTPMSNNSSVKEQQNIKQYCSSTFGRDFTLPQYQTSSVRGETNLNRNNSSAFVFMGNLQPSNLSEDENTQVKCGLCFGDEVSQIYFHDETLDTNVKHAEQRKNYLVEGNTHEFLHHSTSEGKNCRTQSFLNICPHCQANMRTYKDRGSQCKFVDQSRRLKEKSCFHVRSSSGMSQNETYLNVNLVDNGIKTMEQGIQTDELHDCHLFNQSKNAGPHNRDVQEDTTNLNVTSQQTTEHEGTDLKIMVNSEESNTSSITIQLKQQKKQSLNYQAPSNSNVTQPSHSTSNVADSHQSKNDEKISEVNIKVHETYSEVHVVIGNKQK